MSTESAPAPARADAARAGGHEDSAFGRLPLLPAEREYATASAHTTCFAYAIATWCFLTGGFVAKHVGAVQGVVCLVAGNLIGIFITTMALGLGCQRYGIEQMDCCKPAFGQRGVRIPLLFYLINMLGWAGLLLVMFGNGVHNIAKTLGYQGGHWIVGAGVAAGLWASYLIVTRGVHLLSVSNSIITPGLGILIVFMLYTLLHDYGWSEIAAAPPLNPGPKPIVDYVIAVELGVASGLSWWGGVGFLARNTRRQRNAIYPEILQLGLSGSIACCIGLFSALVVQSDDPTEWMVPLGGVAMGLLALVFVALANVTSTAVSIFASGLAMRHIKRFRTTPWWQLMLLLCIPCAPFIFWPAELYSMGDKFLAYNGTMYAPISGILFADYFFLRKQKLNLRALFESDASGEYYFRRGFNWLALGSLVLGQALYLFLYNPVTGDIHPLFLYAPASVASAVVPALVYGFGTRWLASRGVDPHADGRVAAAAPRRLIAPNI
ncbi:MAG TPA: cytosine permease [Myxococcota bacterium]|nr:cytosine permease [Myxococcota bacterium]